MPKGMRDIQSGSELLDPFPVFRSGRAGQILFRKDGPEDNRDEFIWWFSHRSVIL